MKMAKDNLAVLEKEYQEFQYNYAASAAVVKWEANVAGVTVDDPGITVDNQNVLDYQTVTPSEQMIYCYTTKCWYYKNCKGGNPSTDDGFDATAGLFESDHKTLTQYYIGYRYYKWFYSTVMSYAGIGTHRYSYPRTVPHLVTYARYSGPASYCLPYVSENSEQFGKDADHKGTIFTEIPSMDELGQLKASAQQHNDATMEAELAQAGFTVNGQSYKSYQVTEGSKYKGIYANTTPAVKKVTAWGGISGYGDLFTRTTEYYSGNNNTLEKVPTMTLEMDRGNTSSDFSRLEGPAYTTGKSSPKDTDEYKAAGFDPNLVGNNNVKFYFDNKATNIMEQKEADALYAKLKATNPDMSMIGLWKSDKSVGALDREDETIRDAKVEWDFSVVYMRKVPTNLEPTATKGAAAKQQKVVTTYELKWVDELDPQNPWLGTRHVLRKVPVTKVIE